jgi:hypothetical protein
MCLECQHSKFGTVCTKAPLVRFVNLYCDGQEGTPAKETSMGTLTRSLFAAALIAAWY